MPGYYFEAALQWFIDTSSFDCRNPSTGLDSIYQKHVWSRLSAVESSEGSDTDGNAQVSHVHPPSKKEQAQSPSRAPCSSQHLPHLAQYILWRVTGHMQCP